jgi:hypothetical protein
MDPKLWHGEGTGKPQAPGRRLVRCGGQGEDVVSQSDGIRAPRTPLERRLDQLVGQEVGSVHRRSTARAHSSERRALKSRDFTVLVGTASRSEISPRDRWSK